MATKTKKKKAKKKAGPKNKGGRPTDYDSKTYPDQVYEFCLLGATDAELAEYFGVVESTINKWKIDHPEFSESMRKGKFVADGQVAHSLFKRANGYSHPEEKVFYSEGEIVRAETTKHYPPDTAAASKWLNNRAKAYWRDRHEVDHSGGLLFSGVEITYAGDKKKK